MKDNHGMTDFIATPHATAKQKADFFEKFKRFVQDGMPWSRFSQDFYRRLCGMFGFIAHYDRHGFFRVWFEDDEKRYAFVQQILNHPAMGQPQFCWTDVESEIQRWLSEGQHLDLFRERAREQTETVERRELKRLKAKYSDPGENRGGEPR